MVYSTFFHKTLRTLEASKSRTSKKFLKQPKKLQIEEFRALQRKNLRIIAELFTVHCQARRHPYNMKYENGYFD